MPYFAFFRTLIGSFLIILALATSAAGFEPILLDGINPVRKIGKQSFIYEDRSGTKTLEQIQQLYQTGKMQNGTQFNLDFGYAAHVNWIVVPIKNRNTTSFPYILSTNWPTVDGIEVYVIGKNQPAQTILSKNKNTPFIEKQFIGNAIVTEQFLIPAKSSLQLFIRFAPSAFGILPLSLETPITAYKVAEKANLGFTGFYGAMLAAVIIFSLFIIAIRHSGGIYFLGIFLSGLLIIAQLDGFLFFYIWPDQPSWHRVAGFPFLLFVNFTSYLLASYMFAASNHQNLARYSHILAYTTLTPLLFWPFIEWIWLLPFGYIFLIIAMSALTGAIFTWAQLLPKKRQFGITFGVFMLFLVTAIMLMIATGTPLINTASHNLIKALFIGMTTATMISYATHISALNQNYTLSLKRELELAKNEAKMNAELLASERKYSEAQELVAKHKHQLATTSHDLKQPITSLRLTMDAIAKQSGQQVEENVACAFDYLEDLVNENLYGSAPAVESDASDTHEQISLGLLIDTAVQMFNEEAISKGISLRHRPSNIEVSTQIIPLMRIINNLVSNSIKHTETGSILITGRRVGSIPCFDIYDTGNGMSMAEISQYKQIYKKGENSAGTGLGLPICFELANQLGLELEITSVKGKGSRFRLKFPN